MSNHGTTKAVVIDPPNGQVFSQTLPLRLALYDGSGNSLTAVKKQEAQDDSAAEQVADLVEDFNALLAKLRNAGILADS